MLQDPNVETYVENVIKPVLKQIKELKSEIKVLRNALSKIDISKEQCYSCKKAENMTE